MATSSIFTDFIIGSQEDAKRFARALQQAEQNSVSCDSVSTVQEITTPEAIQSFFTEAMH